VSLTWAGCRTPTGDTHTAPSATPPGSSATTAVAAASSPTPSSVPQLPYDFEPGCAGDIDPKLAPSDQLEAMGRTCAPGLERMQVWAEPVALVANEPRRLEVELPENACIRIGISSQDAGAVIRVSVIDPKGRGMVEATSHPPTLVPSSGPICTGGSGKHVVEVTSMGAEAKVQVGLWRGVASAAAASSK